MEGVVASFSLALLLLGFGATSPLSLFGVLMALVASCQYLWFQNQGKGDSSVKVEVKHTFFVSTKKPDQPHTQNFPTTFRILGIVMFVMLSALVGVFALHDPINSFQEEDLSTNKQFSTKGIFDTAKRPNCVRKPLPLSTLRSNQSRDYHAFDNVLLIVFFSHARYDVNLDYYQDVYSDYFPNVNYFYILSSLISRVHRFYSLGLPAERIKAFHIHTTSLWTLIKQMRI
jgi:hypothetical protein